LKHGTYEIFLASVHLSALDPGKQGLKQFTNEMGDGNEVDFQRLIQENKD